MQSSITLITGNLGKVEEAKRFLGLPVEHVALDIEEIQSLDPELVAGNKALQAFTLLNRPVLVEDVSFVIGALGNLPGPLIKWFEQELGHEGICRLIDGKDRSCTASVTYAFHDGMDIHFFRGDMRGRVAEHPTGERSFGWASIFVPEGMEKTYAELSDEEQEPLAMRKKALAALREYLAGH